jgi:flagellar protein FlaG
MINSLQTYLATPVKTDPKVSRPAVSSVSGPAVVESARGAQDGSGSGPAGRAEEANRKSTDADVERALQQVSDRLQINQRTLQFSVDKDTQSTVVKVIDSETNKLIRQIPSEELLSISKRLEAATGMLFSDKA